ncbi:MAG: PAS domain S-box protein [Chloroflexaceae bacterium]|nr:PAS domain S-box protein [Chloroflexaceae bacterium]
MNTHHPPEHSPIHTSPSLLLTMARPSGLTVQCIGIVSDDPGCLEVCQSVVEEYGLCSCSGESLTGSAPLYMLLLLDLHNLSPDHIRHLYDIREHHPNLPIVALVACSAVGERSAPLERLSEVVAAGVQGLLFKPVLAETLAATVGSIVAQQQTRYHQLWAAWQYLNDAVFLLDPHTKKILEANPAAEALTGYNRTALLSKAFHSLFDMLDGPNRELLYNSSNGTPRPDEPTSEARLQRADNEHLLVSLGVSRVPYGNKHLLVVIARDISLHVWRTKQAIQVESWQRSGG